MPDWSWTNVAIQAVGGLLGAHAAATAAHDHKFGFIGHSLAGLVAGTSGGYFLQLQAITVVTGTGSVNPASPAEIVVLQVLCGATVGAIAMFTVGMIKKG